MRGTKKITYSISFAVIILFLSMFARIIPCQTAPNIPNPQYNWRFCNINPDSNNQIGLGKKYFGYTSSLTVAYSMVVGLSFIAALTMLHFITKTKKD